MKKLLLMLFFLTATKLYSQDVILLRNGQEMNVSVTEVTVKAVLYTLSDTQKLPVLQLPVKDVFQIRFKDGNKKTFTEQDWKMAQAEEELAAVPAEEMYRKGRSEAKLNYASYRPAGTITLIGSLLSPLVGLIPAVACSVTPPKDKNLDFSSAALMNNPDYARGYKREAKRIKSNKVWLNWGIGLGVNAALYIILSQSDK